MGIVNLIKQRYLNIKWRKCNGHNETVAISKFPIDKVTVGKNTYGPIDMIWLNQEAHVSIGNYCSIGPKVKFLVGGEHNYHRVSTWPFQSKIYEQKTKGNINRDIVVEDDVWIGYGALIMSGVTIGKGSVVGARSIVTKDIPPYSICVGNKVIKKRFSEKIIKQLDKIDFSKISHTKQDTYEELCQMEVTEDNINLILQEFIQ